MWKESYRLGIDRIDQQHMELFHTTDELIRAVAEKAPAATYRKILNFLKDYVVYHFQDEELYQASIDYPGIQAHKAEHAQFAKTILNFEQRLIANHFDEPTVKELAGTLSA